MKRETAGNVIRGLLGSEQGAAPPVATPSYPASMSRGSTTNASQATWLKLAVGVLVSLGAEADGSFVAGYNSSSTANNCLVVGEDCEATADNCAVLGHDCEASGDNSIAIGNGCSSSGAKSVAMGNGASAAHQLCFIFNGTGTPAATDKDGQLVLVFAEADIRTPLLKGPDIIRADTRFEVGEAQGVTENVSITVPTGEETSVTTTLHFVGGIYTGHTVS